MPMGSERRAVQALELMKCQFRRAHRQPQNLQIFQLSLGQETLLCIDSSLKTLNLLNEIIISLPCIQHSTHVTVLISNSLKLKISF